MRRLVSSCALIVAVSGCAPQQPAPTNTVDINAAAETARNDIAAYAANDTTPVPAAPRPSPTPSPSHGPVAPPAPGTPGGLPEDRTPVSEGPFAPDSAQAAANVVQTYYALLEAGKYGQAWALWDRGGQASGMSRADFAASFAKYAEYHAQIGAPGRVDAGAGQRYVTVPVVVYGKLRNGVAVNKKGDVTLHRVADIDGATAAQKSWHINTNDIAP